MLVVMHKDASEKQIQNVLAHFRNLKLKPEKLPGSQRVTIGITGNDRYIPNDEVSRLPGIVEVIHVTHKYKKVSREFYAKDTKVRVGDVVFGNGKPVMIAGPCSVESEKQFIKTAKFVKKLGAEVVRGGIFKPRTSPYSFQGLGYKGLQILKKMRDEVGLPFCVEILSVDDIELFAHEVDIIQIGARSMQNFDLLKRLAEINKPMLLKRGPWATVEEFLLAAEYLLSGSNNQVILCERGIKTFESSTRNTLDLNSVALIKKLTHLPIIVDPSHAAGNHEIVGPLSRAALAVGADGLLVEVHPNPLKALSDQKQQLDFKEFEHLMKSLQIFM
ncbi:MAG: 3-deoxy-7-phosphoheptulonate synthase [Bacteroidetes bacterium]|nr:3-deoxy-7-phosphoheptulonate synthase [Bacteroidota bacterium]